MAKPTREGTCKRCRKPIRRRKIRGATLDSPNQPDHYHYTCGNCLDPELLEDDDE